MTTHLSRSKIVTAAIEPFKPCYSTHRHPFGEEDDRRKSLDAQLRNKERGLLRIKLHELELVVTVGHLAQVLGKERRGARVSVVLLGFLSFLFFAILLCHN